MGNNRRSARKCFWMNPRQLLFTQADIKSTFTDPTLPSVRETASLIRRGLLDPAVFAPLHVFVDEYRRFWCANNRRLFALREAGVSKIDCVCCGNKQPKKWLKEKLSDPAFMPKIRGEASYLQIPPPLNSNQMQREPTKLSFVGNASAGYLNRHLSISHESEEEEDELWATFSQLDVNSSTYPTRTESACSGKWGEVSHNASTQPYEHIPSSFDLSDFEIPNSCLYEHKEAEDDSVPVRLGGNWRGKNVVDRNPNNVIYVPTISSGESGVRIRPPPTSGRNGYQMERGASASAAYSKRGLYKSYADHGVHYEYKYKEINVDHRLYLPSYEVEGELEWTVASEDQDEYEFENRVQYEKAVEYEEYHPVASEGFPDDGEDIMEYLF